MSVAIIAVSKNGLFQASRLRKAYPAAHLYVPERLCREAKELFSADFCGGDGGSAGSMGPLPLAGGLTAAMGELFPRYRVLIFISAVAVAVRAAAPNLRGKSSDPAVVVVDEGARFAISLLSGHSGGANEVTAKIAALLGAAPVITTATDLAGLTAFDDLARRQGWALENGPDLKLISAFLLEGRDILVFSEQPFPFPLQGKIKISSDRGDLDGPYAGIVIVSTRDHYPRPPQGTPHVVLRPRNIYAGVGCRRGTAASCILNALQGALKAAGVNPGCLAALASIELKAGEPGLIEAARLLERPLVFYPAEKVSAAVAGGEGSDFVLSISGSRAVAAPCARIASGGGPIILPTRRSGGITVALARGRLDQARPGMAAGLPPL